MCGLCGYAGFDDERLLEAMTATLVHRGPDDEGYYRAPGIGFGHRRLSIIDVAGGHQPLFNEDGSLAAIVNGELYDHVALREELAAKGHTFRTRSDSELALHLYEEHGLDFPRRINGMFAIALWDSKARRLVLVRDRIGIKPLYYAEQNGKLVFASESKALLEWRELRPTLDPRGVRDYLALRYVPGPGGMFREVKKLPAGHRLVFENGRARVERWWTPELCVEPDERGDGELLDEFAERFERSIRRRLVSEVPVGAYLSGGLDSTTIVAAIAKQVTHPVRTFTVGFDYRHDELAQAARTAEALGCVHTEIRCRAADVALVPEIVWHLDEPVGDPIVIPMYQLAREAKKQVTVVLTGEGADELFAGYLFHKVLMRGHGLARALPRFARERVLRPLVAATPAGVLDLAFQYPAELGQRGKQKVVDLLGLLAPEQLPEAYLHLISLFDERDTRGLFTDDFRAELARADLEHTDVDRVTAARAAHAASLGALAGRARSNGALAGIPHPAAWDALDPRAPFLNRVLHLQFEHWLSDDILTKQDKLSMASAIEGRVPFLDHELVEFALRLPPRAKLRGKTGKWIVRRYAEHVLPEAARPVARGAKQPFYNPLEQFPDEPAFRELLDATLSEKNVRERGLFRPEAVAALRDSVRGGEFVHAKQVFSLMALELWFQAFVDRRRAA